MATAKEKLTKKFIKPRRKRKGISKKSNSSKIKSSKKYSKRYKGQGR